MFLIGGGALLAAAILTAWYGARRKHAATALAGLLFIPLWLAVAAWNLATGMAAGYALMSEAPLFLAIFLPPALLALWIRVRFHYA